LLKAGLPTLPASHLSEEQFLLCGRTLAWLCFSHRLCLLLVTLNGLLLHLDTSKCMNLLLPWEPVQEGLVQQGLVLTELLLCLFGVALRLPGWLTRFGDNLQCRGHKQSSDRGHQTAPHTLGTLGKHRKGPMVTLSL
jgi:hypothetical protein